MSLEENKKNVRRTYDELWKERKLELADEVIAAEGYVNYDTDLSPVPADPEHMKQTVRLVTAAFPDNDHEVEERSCVPPSFFGCSGRQLLGKVAAAPAPEAV